MIKLSDRELAEWQQINSRLNSSDAKVNKAIADYVIVHRVAEDTLNDLNAAIERAKEEHTRAANAKREFLVWLCGKLGVPPTEDVFVSDKGVVSVKQ